MPLLSVSSNRILLIAILFEFAVSGCGIGQDRSLPGRSASSAPHQMFVGIRVFTIKDQVSIQSDTGESEEVPKGSLWVVRGMREGHALVNGSNFDGWIRMEDIAPLSAAPFIAKSWMSENANDPAADLVLGYYWVSSAPKHADEHFLRAYENTKAEYIRAWAAFGRLLAREFKGSATGLPRLESDPFLPLSDDSPWVSYLKSVASHRSTIASGPSLSDTDAGKEISVKCRSLLDAIRRMSTRHSRFGRLAAYEAVLLSSWRFPLIEELDERAAQTRNAIARASSINPSLAWAYMAEVDLMATLEEPDLETKIKMASNFEVLLKQGPYSSIANRRAMMSLGQSLRSKEYVDRILPVTLDALSAEPFDLAQWSLCGDTVRTCGRSSILLEGPQYEKHAKLIAILKDEASAENPLESLVDMYGRLPIRPDWALGIDRLLSDYDPENPYENNYLVALTVRHPEDGYPSPLHRYAESPECREDAIIDAVFIGADVNILDEKGVPLLHSLLRNRMERLVFRVLVMQDNSRHPLPVDVAALSPEGKSLLLDSLHSEQDVVALALLLRGCPVGEDELGAMRKRTGMAIADRSSLRRSVEAEIVDEFQRSLEGFRQRFSKLPEPQRVPIGMGPVFTSDTYTQKQFDDEWRDYKKAMAQVESQISAGSLVALRAIQRDRVFEVDFVMREVFPLVDDEEKKRMITTLNQDTESWGALSPTGQRRKQRQDGPVAR